MKYFAALAMVGLVYGLAFVFAPLWVIVAMVLFGVLVGLVLGASVLMLAAFNAVPLDPEGW